MRTPRARPEPREAEASAAEKAVASLNGTRSQSERWWHVWNKPSISFCRICGRAVAVDWAVDASVFGPEACNALLSSLIGLDFQFARFSKLSGRLRAWACRRFLPALGRERPGEEPLPEPEPSKSWEAGTEPS